MNEIKCKCGCGQSLINPSRHLLWKIRSGKDAGYINGHHSRGERNSRWAGESRTENGYIFVREPDNPMADRRGYVRLHRLVMSEHLGRPLLRDEIVHHKNGDKTDNRLENLELTDTRSHMMIHRENGDIPSGRSVVEPKPCLTCGKPFIGKSALCPATQANRLYCCRRCFNARDNAPKGENHWATKLSDDDVRKIRSLVHSGRTHQSVADEFAIGREAVSKIVNRSRWAHVD